MTAWDAKTRLQVAEELLDNGMNIDVAADELGLGRTEVHDIASKHGFPDFDTMMRARDTLVKLAATAPAAASAAAKPVPPTAGTICTISVGGFAPPARPDAAATPLASVARGASSASAQELVDVPIDDLVADVDNPREDATADIEDLVASILQAGLLQPVVAQRRPNGTLQIVAGHRRHAALRRLGWSTVPTVVRDEMGRAEVLAAMLIENSQRKDLDPIQEARAVQHLKTRHGLSSDAKVADRIGKNQVWVSSRLALLDLTPDDQRRVRAGDLTVSSAVRLGREQSGRARGTRATNKAHLSGLHPLARLAQQLCEQEGHLRGNRLAKTACGACWEQVIRANERRTMQGRSAQIGTCVCCDQEMP